MNRALLVALPLVLAASPARAATYAVPGDFSSVTAAVTSAGVGDVIQIAAGTYSPSTTGETFPLTVNVDGVQVVGAGMGLTIMDAEDTGSVFVFDAPTGRIANMTITGGRADRGGGVHVLQGSPQLSGLLVHANGAKLRGSGIQVEGTASPWIHHNVVWESYDTDLTHMGDPHGIQIGGMATGLVENNLVGRTDSNGLFYQESGAPIVRNNIFYQNGTPGVRGRGICALGSATAEVIHNLFWDNAIAALIMNNPAGGFIDVSAAMANDLDPADGVHSNLDGDPLFLDPDNLDFDLPAGSPAIDAGDPASPLDPDGTVADIGPFFYDQSALAGGVPLPRVAALLPNVPNPFNPATQVRVNVSVRTHVELDVVDARGRRVRALVRGVLEPGVETIRWDGRDDRGREVVSGVYLATLRAVGELTSMPIVLVR